MQPGKGAEECRRCCASARKAEDTPDLPTNIVDFRGF